MGAFGYEVGGGECLGGEFRVGGVSRGETGIVVKNESYTKWAISKNVIFKLPNIRNRISP